MIDFFDERYTDLITNMKIPSTYHTVKSLEYQFFFRSLLQKIDSSIIFTGLPKGFSDDLLHFCLWVRGYVVFFETNRKDLAKFGDNKPGKNIVFQPCFAGGELDFYYEPTKAYVANPHMKYQNEFTLGKDALLLKLTPDCFYRGGVLDIIDFYTRKLAELSKGIDMSIINSKFGFIASASNEAQAATLGAVMDALQAGNPLVIYKDTLNDGDEIIPRKEPFETFVQELKKNYVLTEQLGDFQTILNSFYTEIGLPVAIEKKERIITSEADFASAQSQARISCWVQTLKESLEAINEKFGLQIGVEYARETNDIGNRSGTEQDDAGEKS